ncbi:MAG: ribonuclease PH [Tissierella sp.]|uniref:ribonuclease PH n=1 Tax=Tissierella sp. TaxID=41274 RepID=UPI003F98610D
MRIDNRRFDQLRDIKISRNYIIHPYGSVLIESGNTKVICTANFEERVPYFLKGTGSGWITAEYSMLPGSTIKRKTRNSSRGKIDGRTQEIQRLIGRSLRSVVDMKAMGERALWIDCDVVQADGGTRTAAITGSFIAMVDAFYKLKAEGKIKKSPIKNYLSAISVGVTKEGNILDLCYKEDHNAIVDMNIVMTCDGKFIEIQGTGETDSFSRDELNKLLDLGEKGNKEIIEMEKEILEDVGGFQFEE